MKPDVEMLIKDEPDSDDCETPSEHAARLSAWKTIRIRELAVISRSLASAFAVAFEMPMLEEAEIIQLEAEAAKTATAKSKQDLPTATVQPAVPSPSKRSPARREQPILMLNDEDLLSPGVLRAPVAGSSKAPAVVPSALAKRSKSDTTATRKTKSASSAVPARRRSSGTSNKRATKSAVLPQGKKLVSYLHHNLVAAY